MKKITLLAFVLWGIGADPELSTHWVFKGGTSLDPARIKLDISGAEKIARPTILRDISHPYSDSLPAPAQVRCYAFEEVFAEKLRAMGKHARTSTASIATL